MKVEFKNRFTGVVLFVCEVPDDVESGLRHLFDACEVAPSGCLEWTLSLTAGAGRVSMNGKRVYAHRAVFEALHGPIPVGLLVRHRCDNRKCIHPDHLELGTHEQNMADMVLRGRSTKGRSRSAEHRMKLSIAGRGKTHPIHVKQAIAAGVHRSAELTARRASRDAT